MTTLEAKPCETCPAVDRPLNEVRVLRRYHHERGHVVCCIDCWREIVGR